MVVRIRTRGIPETEKFLKQVPHGTRKIAAQEVSDYLIGDTRHGLRHYAPYKKVTRTQAYGQPFQSDKQRRWFFWALKSGQISVPYNRTGLLRSMWSKTKSVYQPVIRNLAPYAKWVLGDDDQSALHNKMGWRTLSQNISDNMKGAMLRANQAIARWLKAKQR